MQPNPFIEGTATSKLRLLAAAPHVKRCTAKGFAVNLKIVMSMIALAVAGRAFAAGSPDPQVLELTEQGVGSITADTRFDRALVQKLLPNLKVEDSVSSTEGEEFPVLLVSDVHGLIFTINPAENSRIFSVVIEKNRVVNSLGHRTGQSYKSIFRDAKAECYPGMEEDSGSVLCTAPKAHHILYLFDGKWNGPDGRLPPDHILSKWKMTRIVWKP